MPSVPSLLRRNESGEIDYVCPQNHRVYGETVEWRTNGKGNRYPNCRTCRQAYRRQYKKRPEVKAKKRAVQEQRKVAQTGVPTVHSITGREIPFGEYMGTEKRSVPWNLLRPRAEASLAFDEFNEALKVTSVPCRGRAAEFTEYSDPRGAYADDNEGRLPMPGSEQARLMCRPCPLFDLCGDYAKLDKPDFGIHAGQRWLGGRVV